MDEQTLRWLSQLPDLLPRIQEFIYVLDPANVTMNAASIQSFTASGLVTDDKIFVNVSLTAGLVLYANARIPADDRLEIVFQNTTGSDIDQASTTFHVIAIR